MPRQRLTARLRPGETLGRLGERAALRAISRQAAPGTRLAGDGAEMFSTSDETLWVASVDYAPSPALALLQGRVVTPVDSGHLAAIVSQSDIEASGAVYWGSQIVLDVDQTLSRQAARELIRDVRAGHDDAVREANGQTMDILVRPERETSLRSVAFGLVPHGQQMLLRSGARPGDSIYVIGPFGEFWSTVAAIKFSLGIPVDETVVSRPRPQTGVGRIVGRLATSGSDVSDGVYQTLRNITDASGVGARLDLRTRDFPGRASMFSSRVLAVAERLKIDPAALAVSWGDWSLVVTIAPEKCSEFESECQRIGRPFREIGTISANRGIWVETASGSGRITGFEAQHFADKPKGGDGWQTAFSEVCRGEVFEPVLLSSTARLAAKYLSVERRLVQYRWSPPPLGGDLPTYIVTLAIAHCLVRLLNVRRGTDVTRSRLPAAVYVRREQLNAMAQEQLKAFIEAEPTSPELKNVFSQLLELHADRLQTLPITSHSDEAACRLQQDRLIIRSIEKQMKRAIAASGLSTDELSVAVREVVGGLLGESVGRWQQSRLGRIAAFLDTDAALVVERMTVDRVVGVVIRAASIPPPPLALNV